VAFAENQRSELREADSVPALGRGGGKPGQGYPAVREGLSVRRLTPTECERLQGFPDGFTQIPWRNKEPENCPDGPRYKALGNSMAVPVMKWIGERIQAVEDLQ
jgi:DNA (cytosine-5)-methyltransferase 1